MQDLDLEKILEENERLKKENQKLKKMLKNLESKDNLNYFLQNNKKIHLMIMFTNIEMMEIQNI